MNSSQTDFPFSAIKQYAAQVREEYDVPGLSLAIVKDGDLVMATGFGVLQLGDRQPVDEHSLFGIASISKSFTALSLGMLVDEGKLKWDDQVIKYLPHFQLYDAYATRELSILDLLVHRTGLAPVSGGTVWYGSDYDRFEVIERIRYLKPISSFRSEYAYQNITYLVAGQVVKTITGISWDEFVRQRIFTPLQMRRSNTSILSFGAEKNVAQPHSLVDGEMRAIAPRNYDNVGPAASINTSVFELASYVKMLLNGGIHKGRQLISPEVARDLWTPHTLIPVPTDYATEIERHIPQFHNAYALGWVTRDFLGKRRVFHSGGIDGIRSLVTMIPEDNLGIIVFANNEGPATWVMSNIILDLYHAADPADWYDAACEEWRHQLEKKTGPIQVPAVADTTPSLELENYGGLFYSETVGEIEVRFEQEQLTVQFPHTPSFTAHLSHWHYDTFRAVWQDQTIPDGLISFLLDARGNVCEIRFDQPALLDVDFSELHPIKRVNS